MSSAFTDCLFPRPVRFRNRANHPAGIAGGHHARGNVAVDHAAGADHAAAADRHARQNADAGTDPDVVADRYRPRIFQPPAAQSGVKRMPGGIESAVRTDKNVVAENDFCPVKYNAIMVGVKVFADFNVSAVIAPKGGIDFKTASGPAEQPADQRPPFVFPCRRQPVIFKTQFLAAAAFGQQFFVIIGVIQQPLPHFFFFRHGFLPVAFNITDKKNQTTAFALHIFCLNFASK